MTVTFHNVTISLEATTPRQAYDDFCAHLDLYDRARGGGVIDWESSNLDEYKRLSVWAGNMVTKQNA